MSKDRLTKRNLFRFGAFSLASVACNRLGFLAQPTPTAEPTPTPQNYEFWLPQPKELASFLNGKILIWDSRAEIVVNIPPLQNLLRSLNLPRELVANAFIIPNGFEPPTLESLSNKMAQEHFRSYQGGALDRSQIVRLSLDTAVAGTVDLMRRRTEPKPNVNLLISEILTQHWYSGMITSRGRHHNLLYQKNTLTRDQLQLIRENIIFDASFVSLRDFESLKDYLK